MLIFIFMVLYITFCMLTSTSIALGIIDFVTKYENKLLHKITISLLLVSIVTGVVVYVMGIAVSVLS